MHGQNRPAAISYQRARRWDFSNQCLLTNRPRALCFQQVGPSLKPFVYVATLHGTEGLKGD